MHRKREDEKKIKQHVRVKKTAHNRFRIKVSLMFSNRSVSYTEFHILPYFIKVEGILGRQGGKKIRKSEGNGRIQDLGLRREEGKRCASFLLRMTTHPYVC